MFYVHPEPWKNYDPIWFAHIFSNGLVQPPDNQLFPLKHRTCRLDRSFIILSLEAGIFQTRIPVDGFFFFEILGDTVDQQYYSFWTCCCLKEDLKKQIWDVLEKQEVNLKITYYIN